MVKDPVCGMEIEAKNAFATRGLNGTAVYLCSSACAKQYDANPDQHLKHPAPAGPATDARDMGLQGRRSELPVTGFGRHGTPALCSEMVVLADFNKSAQLPVGKTVPVEFLPNKPGEYEFACQMGMFRGRLIVE